MNTYAKLTSNPSYDQVINALRAAGARNINVSKPTKSENVNYMDDHKGEMVDYFNHGHLSIDFTIDSKKHYMSLHPHSNNTTGGFNLPKIDTDHMNCQVKTADGITTLLTIMTSFLGGYVIPQDYPENRADYKFITVEATNLVPDKLEILTHNLNHLELQDRHNFISLLEANHESILDYLVA